MPPIRTVLVAVKDPNARSLPAVAKGAQIARGFGARLELFHGITDPILAEAAFYANGALQKLERDTKARFVERLEEIAAPLREGGLQVNVSVDWDFPAHEAIVRRARRRKADLIVAECHAGRHLTPWLLHLTDWELLRTSPVPVLLVKSGATWADLNVLAAIDPSHAFAKPAKLDSRILSAATAFSSALKGSLHVMHSYIPVPVGTMPTVGASVLAVTQIAEGEKVRAKRRFEKAIAASRLPKSRQHLIQGQPAEEIPEVARKIGAGLVVMGAISRSGLKRFFIGNTAERVLNDLPCDVLVVKPLSFRTRVAKKTKGMHFVGLPQVGMSP
jgi:universal stress protein E